MIQTMVDINEIKEYTEANIIVILDTDGNTIDSYQTEYSSNISLMSKTAFSMCNDLLKDMTGSDLKQLIAKCDENYYIINKTQDDQLVLIATDDSFKLGLLMKYMNEL